jgi:hypothetical protein
VLCVLLPRIFRPEKEEFSWGWRKLHNEKLHNSYFSTYINNYGWLNQGKFNGWSPYKSRYSWEMPSCRIMARKPWDKISLGRCGRKLGGGIKMDPKEAGYENVNSVCLPRGRSQWRPLVDTIWNLWLNKGREISYVGGRLLALSRGVCWRQTDLQGSQSWYPTLGSLL